MVCIVRIGLTDWLPDLPLIGRAVGAQYARPSRPAISSSIAACSLGLRLA